MKINLRLFFALCVLLTAVSSQARGHAKGPHEILSPSGSIKAVVGQDDGLHLSITVDGKPMLSPSPIGMVIDGNTGTNPKITAITKNRVKDEVISPFYRQKSFTTECNQMTLKLSDGLMLEVRAYDDGVAYRFINNSSKALTIIDEKAEYMLPSDFNAWLPYSTNDKNPLAMAYQNTYDFTKISHAKDKLAFLPLTVDCGDFKFTLTESDLRAYPGMFVKADTSSLSLMGVFAPYPAKTDFYPWRVQQYVTATEPFIAKCEGKRDFPWRIFAITRDDCEMPVNNLVYALAEKSKIDDTSWIKPGKVAWDWWNDWGLKNVPFRAGINMDTYKHYIDFASENSIEYIILDEGWYDPKSGDMLTVIPELDLEALVRYGESKNVGIVLWTVFNVLDTQLEEACARYKEMGIKGFKVDFLDRDDQTAVEMVYRICEATATHKLLLDLHGIYKPTGLNRTYPNVLNFESVFGMEEMKWSVPTVDMPLYDVTFPFIRLLAGPVDYTPGAMRNATKDDWKAVYRNPISMGTRCHQLATYIVYDSPFTMLCDAPSNYVGEEECVRFIVDTPNEIDETRILGGELGKYIVSARRHGSDWWIGALTNWDARDIEIDLTQLGVRGYNAYMMVDGPNADEQAEDYIVKEIHGLPDKINVHLAPGGGFVCRIRP